MSFPPKSDLWHVGLAPAPQTTFLAPAALPALRDRLVWLPDPGPWRYLADPFGVRRGGTTHVFVEAYDYRTKHAVIEHHAFDAALVWQGKSVALEEPVHLSYPFLLEHGGETFMVPESCRAGEVALFRHLRSPLSRLVTDRYSPRLWIGRVAPVPVLVIHGDADRVVPPAHGERLYAGAGEPKALWIVPGAGHIESFASPDVRARLLRFLSDAFRAKTPPADLAP